MAGTERRFNQKATVGALKTFLINKIERFEKGIQEKRFSGEGEKIAQHFIYLIEDLLNSEYFHKMNEETEISTFLARLIAEDREINKKLSLIQAKIEGLESELELKTQYQEASCDYIIPSEASEYMDANESQKERYRGKIEKEKEKIDELNYKLNLCRKLKGIINRPNGFFGSVYK